MLEGHAKDASDLDASLASAASPPLSTASRPPALPPAPPLPASSPTVAAPPTPPSVAGSTTRPSVVDGAAPNASNSAPPQPVSRKTRTKNLKFAIYTP
jgi:hypothetical protein